MSSLNYTGRGTDCPYRTGVLIGNFVEDMYGYDLKKKYEDESKTQTVRHNRNLSEQKDKFRWPTYAREELFNPGNELTMTCTSNFDLNIDFNRKNVKDFMTLSKANEYVLDNKNTFLKSEVKAENFQKLNEEKNTGLIQPPSVFSETQKVLKNNHIYDTNGILYSRTNGLKGNLLLGHGCQKRWTKNDLASVYHLSLNRHIATKTFLDPHWKLDQTQKKLPPLDRDYSDWGFRKYKEYGRFTKKFDKKKK